MKNGNQPERDFVPIADDHLLSKEHKALMEAARLMQEHTKQTDALLGGLFYAIDLFLKKANLNPIEATEDDGKSEVVVEPSERN